MNKVLEILGAAWRRLPAAERGWGGGVTARTLLVTGELSPSCPLRLSDRLQELLPNAEHVEIADASHAMTAQNAPAFNEAILAFLDRLSHRR